MNLFKQLSHNKGTVSSAPGKDLAQQVLGLGRAEILMECIALAAYQASKAEARHIRAGAAKVVEIVAEERPEMVAPHLEKLLPALAVSEPQTRWMIMRVMGFCAQLNPAVARMAVEYAEKYLQEKEGLCVASSADLFLGDLGAVSKEDALQVFPLLAQSLENPLTNEPDWLLEALIKVLPQLAPDEREVALDFARHWQYSPRKSTQQRARKLLKL